MTSLAAVQQYVGNWGLTGPIADMGTRTNTLGVTARGARSPRYGLESGDIIKDGEPA
jgi:hypothetical protein